LQARTNLSQDFRGAALGLNAAQLSLWNNHSGQDGVTAPASARPPSARQNPNAGASSAARAVPVPIAGLFWQQISAASLRYVIAQRRRAGHAE
jgi:hypothetical protein